jgi:signal peptidase I
MTDHTETETQARTDSAGTVDKEQTDTTAPRTDSAVGRSNGLRQRVDRYSTVVESRASRDADRKSATAAVAPFRKGVAREYFESAVVTFVMALFGMTFIVQAVKVPTGSMKNTIYIGDHLLVNKFLFGPEDGIKLPILPDRNIKRGDVIVFKYPRGPETNYVKRVIGLPGDMIEYNPETHRVFINGEELPEHRIRAFYQDSNSPDPLEQNADEGAPPGSWYTVYYQHDNDTGSDATYAVGQPFRVPRKGDPIPDNIKNSEYRDTYDADHDGRYDADQYFCMGDNRDNSEDSRYWGTVPRSNVVGHAMFVYWSISPGYSSGNASPNEPVDSSSRPRWADVPARTRWWRTGKFIK